MPGLSCRSILVADDFKDWRRQVRFAVSGTAGMASHRRGRRTDQKPFRKAKELKPDLIVLNIGLPKLSGIRPPSGYAKCLLAPK